MSTDRRQSGLWNRNPETGFFEQAAPIPTARIQANQSYGLNKGPYPYYEPPALPRGSGDENRRSFSNPTTKTNGEPLVPTTNGAGGSASKKHREAAIVGAEDSQIPRSVQEVLNQHPETTSAHLAKTQHVNETSLPGSAQQEPLRIDPDYVPNNLRNKPRSPDPLSPRTQPAQPVRTPQESNTSKMSETIRRGSVPDRSPLQNLEYSSKGAKRARVEEAEHRARQNSQARAMGDGPPMRPGTVRSEKGRVVSDGPKRSSGSQRKVDRNRQVSEPYSPVQKFHEASQALKMSPVPNEQLQSPKQRHSQPVANQPRPYDRRSAGARDGHAMMSPVSPSYEAPRGSVDLNRTTSGKYRARDAGFAGATAAAFTGATISSHDNAAERGKAAYERRKSSMQNAPAPSPVSPVTQDSPDCGRSGLGVGRSGSKKLQKRSPLGDEYATRKQRQGDRTGGLGGGRKDRQAAEAYHDPDPVRPADVQNAPNDPIKYAMPPQTAAGQHAKEQVAFGVASDQNRTVPDGRHHKFGGIFHQSGHDHRGYQASSEPLEDWRRAKTARLTVEDMDFEQTVAAGQKEDGAWWEKNRRPSSSGSKAVPNMAQYDGPYEEHANGFQPRLFMKCGPLLRYTGIRKETGPARSGNTSGQAAKEVWRGSVMVVTEDDQSDLSSTPTLRLFAQPADLQPPPPQHLLEGGHELPPEYEDPVAGQVKLSRTGRALFARPVQELDGGIDLSREENNDGLYSATRPALLGPQTSTGPDGRQIQHISFQDKSRIKKRDGERAGRYRDVKAVRLHTEQGHTFWRFNIEVELASSQRRIAYRINKGPAVGFWVPARGETMNIMFHSCNGFSLSVDSNNFSGPDPLWRDVLNRHQSRPFHVMLGGGDQIYNDAAMRDTELFREWLQTKNPEHKHSADFTPEMQEELEQFYLERYCMWFSQGLFSMANSQIPMVNMWDDHDIIDGYGSYPHHFMSTRVFTGLGAVAYKYYMLFQHQSLSAETEREEPSWLLGKSPGPYINELSRSVFMSLGRNVALLGLDCRTERMRDEILSQETYDTVFDRCRAEIVEGETKHLLVLLGVPIAYPRLNFLENILTSRVMDPIKAIGRTGMLGGFVNKFDGGVEILDDLDDHWTAKHHKAERNWFIQELQELAAEKSVRITILGGDVHLGAVGQFHSNKKLGISKDRDHRYMPNVVSSAIVNTPPPVVMADVLNKRNKVHRLDAQTDEDMIPMFSHDVDGSRRNNNHLLPRRNFCVIREYLPGSTPPSTPVRERIDTAGDATFGAEVDGMHDDERRDRRHPPGSMKRTMSLTRGPAALVRRFSGSSKRDRNHPPVSLAPAQTQPYDAQPAMKRANSLDQRRDTSGGSYFPENGVHNERPSFQGERRPSFRRRPTDLSIKEAKKSAANFGEDGNLDAGHIDLEGGLDISLCMEKNQHDPTGTTIPYRLLVPALWYVGEGDANTVPARSKVKHAGLMDRLKWNRNREAHVDGEDDHGGAYPGSDRSHSPSLRDEEKFDPVTERNTAANAMGLTQTGRGAVERQHSGPYPINGTGTGRQNATPRQVRSTGGSEIPSQGYNINTTAPEPIQHASVDAYNRGFNKGGPPIGQQAGPGADNDPYPQSGYRRTSAPQAAGPSQGDPAGNGQMRRGVYGNHAQGYDGYDSAGSLTPSEEYDDDEPPVRRGSKAAQLLGFGAGFGKRTSMQEERPVGGELGRANTTGGASKKAGWKIWR
ncbi:hypothetical protein CLAFUW4_08084 [Fulvia fulva]|uniref:PhoD-like phosphatase domain-containing protein n=1 Tax=Passalora fulva TaxID=5499 RepID=A0A9Q8P6W6_PASFU|nr:uncharacterized protein CLAFUR5_08201 [Fulvia fulva]KAK4628888.1 hypothetical protein CLAFUR4_08089 [Fulvia fulva]KAK4629859.1 hypothetical protein CLAFUR0_08084 [Fulvia fulva]UJO15449.1 hypothetical protein CLAFUR5_08201 [Fulvia fulva]WPV12266.1 hypothetical protein CLAFUW4_08084 [Fulvia fulva]WPV27749.1 hypothetical protein CLAFUW7_08084 [Fulvia fulva]